jgi:hypothetical protein
MVLMSDDGPQMAERTRLLQELQAQIGHHVRCGQATPIDGVLLCGR